MIRPKTVTKYSAYIGQKIASLTILDLVIEEKNYFRCLCDCGVEKSILVICVLGGNTKSCGCQQGFVKHGHNREKGKRTATYNCWDGMKQRILNPNCRMYHRYGGRGLTLCGRWMQFENFLEDMGEQPKGLQIERKNNNLGYSPDNCYWATPKQQMRNVSTNKIIEFSGESHCVAEWAEMYGLDPNMLNSRLHKGWPMKDALTLPKFTHIRKVKNG